MRSKLQWGLFLFTTAAVFRCVGGDDNIVNDGGNDSSLQDNNVNDVANPQDSNVVDSAGACTTPPTTTFYVNATSGSDSNNGGGPTCALKTITAALTSSTGATHANATINIAAGTYGVNETFPLIVNNGRSLVGADASTTKIQGSSANYNTNGTGSFLDGTDAGTNQNFVTIVAGDFMGGTNKLGATTISNVTVVPAANIVAPTTHYVGIACIAGNGPAANTTVPLPTPNLVLSAVTVGPNYDTALAIGSSPDLSTACNLGTTSSTFTGSNVGIATGTCGAANPSVSWPSAQIGDGQIGDANTFTADGIGIFGEGCGVAQSYNANKFVSGYRGVVLVSQPAQYFEILGNSFDGSTSPFMGIGINTNAAAAIAKLNDNKFTNIGETAAADTAVQGTTGFAIALGIGHIGQAQRNVIANNDNGLTIGSYSSTFDFSSDNSMINANQFYCNSKTTTETGNGYDLILGYSGGTALNFSGNIWDHGPPTTSVSTTTSANGTDYVTGTSAGASTGNYGAAVTTACAAGRTH